MTILARMALVEALKHSLLLTLLANHLKHSLLLTLLSNYKISVKTVTNKHSFTKIDGFKSISKQIIDLHLLSLIHAIFCQTLISRFLCQTLNHA